MSDAAIAAARGLRRDFGEVEKLQVSMKGPGDFVSNADTNCEKKLVQALQKARPDYGFLLEEGGEIKGKNKDYRWIIDPLDGTSNFLHSIPYFCISIGLEKTLADGVTKEIISGVIYDPLRNELFWAEKGVGAFCDNQRLRVSKRAKIEDSMFASESPSQAHLSDEFYFPMIKAIGSKAFGIRCTGSAALDLAYTAAGKYDGFWRSRTKAWDVAAGILMVKEAGGMVTEIGGGNNPLHGGNIVATNAVLHKTVDRLISEKFFDITAQQKKQV